MERCYLPEKCEALPNRSCHLYPYRYFICDEHRQISYAVRSSPMARLRSAVAVFSIFCTLTLSAATRIDDPKAFVSDVYRQLIASQSGHDYTPPDDIYSARLAKLFREDRRKAKGEVGCLEILFWVNGQDYVIRDLSVTSADQGPDRKTVTARFMNIDRREEIRFDFLRNGRRWLLDEVHSTSATPWTLSEILKCSQ